MLLTIFLFKIKDYLSSIGSANGSSRKNAKVSNLQIVNNNNDASSLAGSPTTHSLSPQSHHNLSPISYSTQVPSPLTNNSNLSTSTASIIPLQNVKTNTKKLFLVPNILASPSIPTSSVPSPVNATTHHLQHSHYPHAIASSLSQMPMPTINNHLYQTATSTNVANQLLSAFGSSNGSQTSGFFYDSGFQTTLDQIKMENNATPHIHHTNLSRSMLADVMEKNNNKIIELEMKHSSLAN